MTPADLLFFGALAAATAAETPQSLPDPTRPYQYSQTVDVSMVPAAPQAREWRLNGVQMRNGVRRAILNGKLVKEGDVIGNAKVSAIGTSDITLTVDQKSFVVRLLIPEIKQSIAAARKPESAENK